jgi:hypothetical protein
MIIQGGNGQPICSIISHIWIFSNVESVPLLDSAELHSFMKQSPEAAIYNTSFAMLENELTVPYPSNSLTLKANHIYKEKPVKNGEAKSL